MKKIAAILMAMMMMVSAFAVAEESQMLELDWEIGQQVAEQNGIEGKFYTFDEIAIQVFIPNDMTQSELTDEDRENGFIGHFFKDDGASQVSVQYISVDEEISGEDMMALLSESGAQNVQIALINGVSVIAYDIPASEEDSFSASSLAFATEQGNWLEVVVGSSDPDFAPIATVILCSVQNVAE